jgi:hypothetical protein
MVEKLADAASLDEARGVVFAETRAKWTAIGLATGPAKRKAAEEALHKVYKAAELVAPRKIVWCGSPVALGLTRAIVLDPEFLNVVIASVWEHAADAGRTSFKPSVFESFKSSMRLFDVDTVKKNMMENIKADVTAGMQIHMAKALSGNIAPTITDSVWNGVWASVWHGVWDDVWKGIDKGIQATIACGNQEALENAVRGCLDDSIGKPVKATIWDGSRDIAWGNIRNGVSSKARVTAWHELWGRLQPGILDAVAMPIAECLRACGNDSPQASGYGQQDAYWLAFYDYFRGTEGLVKETETIAGLLDLAQAAGWFTPHATMCWISERPSVLSVNESGKLHAAEGAALAYPDGWQVHATNGVLQFGAGK